MPTLARSIFVVGTLACAAFAMRCGIGAGAAGATSGAAADPAYGAGGVLAYPSRYRSWPFLSSGLDMTYNPAMSMGSQHMFGNVFVNPEALRAFTLTGAWPNKTVLVLEFRAGQSHGSINRRGLFQTGIMGIEVHVRDAQRFRGGWGFFAFDSGARTSPLIPAAASCYACHSAHGAVNTTFVQFYPTLLPIAERRKTLAAGYRDDERHAQR